MEFSEYPSVEGGVDRRLVFPRITWLSKAQFERIIEKCKSATSVSSSSKEAESMSTDSEDVESTEETVTEIQPFLENNYSIGSRSVRNARHLHQVEKRIYVGKTIPKSPWVQHPNGTGGLVGNEGDRSLPFEFTEMIGNVYKSDEPSDYGKWKIKVTHNGYVFDLDDNFLVLQIKDPNSFFWSSNVDPASTDSNSIYFQFNIKEIPNYALRASVDKEKCEYNYIGRTIEEDDDVENGGDLMGRSARHKRPKFFSNGKL